MEQVVIDKTFIYKMVKNGKCSEIYQEQFNWFIRPLRQFFVLKLDIQRRVGVLKTPPSSLFFLSFRKLEHLHVGSFRDALGVFRGGSFRDALSSLQLSRFQKLANERSSAVCRQLLRLSNFKEIVLCDVVLCNKVQVN